MSSYQDTDQVAALARLEENAGNVSKTAREMRIPRTTLIGWRNSAVAAGQAVALPEEKRIDWDEIRRGAGEQYAAISQEVANLVKENLKEFVGKVLTPSDIELGPVRSWNESASLSASLTWTL